MTRDDHSVMKIKNGLAYNRDGHSAMQIQNGRQYTLRGYDCEHPERLTSHSLPEICSQNNKLSKTKAEIQPLSVLQKTEYFTYKGKSCCMFSTTEYFSCAVWSHVKVGTPGEFSEYVEVSRDQCISAHASQSFIDVKGSKHHLNQAGKYTYFSIVHSGHLLIDEKEFQCQGDRVFLQGEKEIQYLVKIERVRFLLEENVNFKETFSNGQIEVEADSIQFSLDDVRGNAATLRTATYILYCRLRLATRP